MMKTLSKLAAIGLGLVFLSACSDQYKIVKPGGTSDDMYAMIDRVQQVSGQSTNFDQSLSTDLLADPTI